MKTRVQAVARWPDGNAVAGTGLEDAIRLRDPASGQVLAEMKHFPLGFFSIA